VNICTCLVVCRASRRACASELREGNASESLTWVAVIYFHRFTRQVHWPHTPRCSLESVKVRRAFKLQVSRRIPGDMGSEYPGVQNHTLLRPLSSTSFSLSIATNLYIRSLVPLWFKILRLYARWCVREWGSSTRSSRRGTTFLFT
jgi:hypothetical protein